MDGARCAIPEGPGASLKKVSSVRSQGDAQSLTDSRRLRTAKPASRGDKLRFGVPSEYAACRRFAIVKVVPQQRAINQSRGKDRRALRISPASPLTLSRLPPKLAAPSNWRRAERRAFSTSNLFLNLMSRPSKGGRGRRTNSRLE